MKISYVEWGAFGSADMREAFIAEGHELVLFMFLILRILIDAKEL